MNGQLSDPSERRVRATARTFSYPPTPDIAGQVQRRLARSHGRRSAPPRVAWVTVAVILTILLAVPRVRAEVWRWVQVGAIRVQLMEESPTPPTVAPLPPRTLTALAGETTLAEAREGASFRVRLPTHPLGLGPPDHVYLQELEGSAVILVWLEPEAPQQVRLTLHQLEADFWGRKSAPRLEETTVNGAFALWVHGPHFLEVRLGEQQTTWEERQLVEGNVLVWVEGGITYRLESTLSLEEAIRVAESLD